MFEKLRGLVKPVSARGMEQVYEPSEEDYSKPLLTLQDIEKVYPTNNGGFTALKGITASFCPGEFVGILGKSGAGKTTLINMITATDRITNGEVIMKGVSIHKMDENQAALWRGQNMGIVYQSFRLMPSLTLVDNVRLPIDFCGQYEGFRSRERAEQLLHDVELSEHAYKHPSAISGGQQQRVAIARALANDPPVIVADEPTGRLDSVTAEVIFRFFKRLVERGKLVIMATHDNTMNHFFTRCITLADGEIVRDTAEEQE